MARLPQAPRGVELLSTCSNCCAGAQSPVRGAAPANSLGACRTRRGRGRVFYRGDQGSSLWGRDQEAPVHWGASPPEGPEDHLSEHHGMVWGLYWSHGSAHVQLWPWITALHIHVLAGWGGWRGGRCLAPTFPGNLPFLLYLLQNPRNDPASFKHSSKVATPAPFLLVLLPGFTRYTGCKILTYGQGPRQDPSYISSSPRSPLPMLQGFLELLVPLTDTGWPTRCQQAGDVHELVLATVVHPLDACNMESTLECRKGKHRCW